MRETLHKAAPASIKEEMALPRVSASTIKAIVARKNRRSLGVRLEHHTCFRWRIRQNREQSESKSLFRE